jgi:hypothetical protein
MKKRYNFLILLLSFVVNFYIEYTFIHVPYDISSVFGVRSCIPIGSKACTTFYTCLKYTCVILRDYDVDYVGLALNRRNECSDLSINDLHETRLSVTIFILIVMLVLVLTCVGIIGLVGIIRRCLGIDVYYHPLSLRRLNKPYWATSVIEYMLVLAHILSLVIAVTIITTAYSDMDIFYLTSTVEITIIIAQIVYFFC